MGTLKGEPGYIHSKKIFYFLVLVLCVVVCFALMFFGKKKYDTNFSWMTILAIVMIVPAVWSALYFFLFACHNSINEAKEIEVSSVTEYVTVLYDMLIIKNIQFIPVDAIVVSNKMVCGYCSNRSVNVERLAEYVRDIAEDNDIDRMTVKFFHDYKGFLARVEGLNNMAAIDQNESHKREMKMTKLLLKSAL